MKAAPSLLAAATLGAALLLPMPARADRVTDAVADFHGGNAAEAAQVLEPLARAGHPDAQFWLGTMYYQGRGKPRLYNAALAWYRRSAEQGNASAQNNLGLMYRNGEGVEPSRLVAYAWFTLAAGRGNGVARENLDALAETMTHAQILQGQQIAEETLLRIESAARRRLAAPLPAVPPTGDVYMVQIGLFQNPDGIRRIRERLDRERLPLRDDEVNIRGARYHRLRLGPYPRPDEAKALAQRIDRLLGVESAVIPVAGGGEVSRTSK